MNRVDTNSEPRAEGPDRSRIIRTALILAAIAVSFYIGFITLGVLNS